MFRLRPALASVAAIVVAAAVVITVSVGQVTARGGAVHRRLLHRRLLPVAERAEQDIQRRGVDYVPTYSATVVDDSAKGRRPGSRSVPAMSPISVAVNGREVGSDESDTGGTEGQTRWYQFSTKFDPTFPQNHADLGWGATNRWHPDTSVGSAAVDWEVGMRNGYWSLTSKNSPVPASICKILHLRYAVERRTMA